MTEPGLFPQVAAALVFAPMLWAIIGYLAPWRALRDLGALLVSVLLLGALALLGGELLQTGPQRLGLAGLAGPVGIELALDGLSWAMLAMTAAVALGVNAYLASWFRAKPLAREDEFRALWLLLWSGLNALFLAGDLFNIYVTLELVSLTAIPLVVVTRGRAAVVAATRYLLFALCGSILYLLAVALVYTATGTLSLALLPTALPAGPLPLAALALMSAGLAMKAALFPVHAWLPAAHAVAPSPASAVLSALVAKAAVYLLLRLWLGAWDGIWTAALAQGLAAIGAAGVIYGSLQALRQQRIKLIIAYSTVAQLGYLLLLPALLATNAWNGAIYHALAHGLAKTALFLAAGNLIKIHGHDGLEVLAGSNRRMPITLLTFALAGVSIAGLPPSGGFLAKWWLLSAALAQGQWWWALVLALGGLLSAAYMVRLLGHGLRQTSGDELPPVGDSDDDHLPWLMRWVPLLLAAAAILLGFTGELLAPLLAVGGAGSAP